MHVPILLTGIVPSGPSGMRDYGDLLAAELRRIGLAAEARWAVNDGSVRSGVAATRRLFALVTRARPGVVVWQYAPVASGHRGVPGPSVLLALVLRLRRVPVITVLHELAEPWRGQPVATRFRAVIAAIALAPILVFSGTWVVTTERRARRLRSLGRLLGRPIYCIPVFSNLGEQPLTVPASTGHRLTIGVMDYGATFARPDIVIGAAQALAGEGPVRVVLIGAPGIESPKGWRWLDCGAAAGFGHIEFTGVLPTEKVGPCLAEMDVLVLPNAQGPSSRKGTLAAALAHGRPVVSFDGPLRWQRLIDCGAVVAVPPDCEALAAALRTLRDCTEEREALGTAGVRFYADEMCLTRAAARFRTIIMRSTPALATEAGGAGPWELRP